MTTDFDNLIRNAKPNVSTGARGRVLDFVQAHGAVASTPAPFRMLLRIAACAMLALLAGVAAALVATPPPQPASVADLPDIAPLIERVGALETDLPVAELNAIADQIAALEPGQDTLALETLVAERLEQRDIERANDWRERHVRHVREHYAAEADATVERLRNELSLTAEQETQVRELLSETGKQAETLIGDFYTKGHHHDRRVNDKFATLAAETDKKIEALLDRQQRDMIEKQSGIVSAAPEDWAPSSEFRDGTDLDVFTNWITVTRE